MCVSCMCLWACAHTMCIAVCVCTCVCVGKSCMLGGVHWPGLVKTRSTVSMCRTFFPLYGATGGCASAGGNLRGEGQKGTWKPSSETPLPPAVSTLSLPFLLVCRCCLAPVPPTPGLLLRVDYSEHSLPLKTSVNYKNPLLLKISGAEWIMEAACQMEAK